MLKIDDHTQNGRRASMNKTDKKLKTKTTEKINPAEKIKKITPTKATSAKITKPTK